jgi:hypothetical protein
MQDLCKNIDPKEQENKIEENNNKKFTGPHWR